MTVHSMPTPGVDEAARRTAAGRLRMLIVLAVCAAPVIASYFTYFVLRPQARSNYADLIQPTRGIPNELGLQALDGSAVASASLKGQWLLIVVGGGACDATCERNLYFQRQLVEMTGRDKARIDKLWLIDDTQSVRPEVLAAVTAGQAARVFRVPAQALSQWLAATPGTSLAQHLYLVDPMGEWMMRTPVQPDPSKFKRDLERLLRASASWDQDGR